MTLPRALTTSRAAVTVRTGCRFPYDGAVCPKVYTPRSVTLFGQRELDEVAPRTLPELLDLVYHSFRDLLPYDRIGIATIDEAGRTVRAQCARTAAKTVKLEAGYQLEANTTIVPPGAGPMLGEPYALPQLGVTASVDYDRGADLTIILEASHVQVFDVPDGRSVYQMSGDHLDLVGTRVQWTPTRGSPFSMRLLGFVDVDGPSYAIKPALGLSGHDNLSLEIAATFFGGPEGSYGGVADRNDEILFTVQYGL